MTHPKYDRQHLPNVLSCEEIVALNFIASSLNKDGDQNGAIRILNHIKAYYDKHIVNTEEALRTQPMILYNLSKLLGESGYYDRCIEICHQSIRLAKETGHCKYMPNSLFILAWAMMRRGRICDIEAAKQAAKEAYILSMIIENNPEFLGKVSSFVKAHFNEDIPPN